MENILTWKYLLEFNYSQPLPNFRSKQVLQNYNDFKNKNKNKNITKYIYKKYLKNKQYLIIENDFPYLTESNVFHYVLWINKSYEPFISKPILEKIIIEKMNELQFDEYIYFENHSSVKTIHDIKHYQIFFKKFFIT